MKYKVVETSMFKKELKIIKKRRKSIQKLKEVFNTLLKGEKLEIKYRDHVLNNDKRFQDCRECHIEPDLLAINISNSKRRAYTVISRNRNA